MIQVMHKPVLNWGYRMDYKYQYNCNIGANYPIDSHCHVLLAGPSGSGKSTVCLRQCGKLLQVCPDVQVTVCDFKNSDDFRFLKPYPYYYSGNDCYTGVMEFYEKFCEVKESGTASKRYVLLFDEYPAAISYWKSRDKINKTTQSADVMNAISELLCLSRSWGFSVWIICQRASAELFNGGSRDNFMIMLALGRQSKEQKGMLFSGENIPEGRIYRPGEGLLLADGAPLTEVCFPLISDMENWKSHILEILMKGRP